MEQNNQQNQPNDNPVKISGGLAKRLAEAADGLRNGATYYMLAKLNYDYDLRYFTSETDSQAYSDAVLSMAALNVGKSEDDLFYLFGPYQTNADDDHFFDHDKVEIKFLKKQGDGFIPVKTITINHKIDAVVFSLAAFDKFFIPYYSRLYGAKKAAEFRVAVVDEFKNEDNKSAHAEHTLNYFAPGV